jgi:hypothetical protein
VERVNMGPKERERRLAAQRVVDRSHRTPRRRYRRCPRWTSIEEVVLVLNIVLYTVAVVLIDKLFVL